MNEEEKKPVVMTGKDAKVTITTADGEVQVIDAKDVTYDELRAKPKKVSGRKRDRMEREARFILHPPGSSWKRADGTTAVAGPRHGRR